MIISESQRLEAIRICEEIQASLQRLDAQWFDLKQAHAEFQAKLDRDRAEAARHKRPLNCPVFLSQGNKE